MISHTTNRSIHFQLLENFPVYNQECVCIEVIAKEINGKAPKSIYFGLIDYDSIKDLVETKVSLVNQWLNCFSNRLNVRSICSQLFSFASRLFPKRLC